MLKAAVQMKEANFQREAVPALERCLAEVPGVRFRLKSRPSRDAGQGVDLFATLALPSGKQIVLLVEFKTSGQPKPVRDAVNLVVNIKQGYANAYPVVLAPYLSARSAELCKQAGVGYVDLAGNCRLAFDAVYLQREGRPNPFTESDYPTLIGGEKSGSRADFVLAELSRWVGGLGRRVPSPSATALGSREADEDGPQIRVARV